MRILFDIFGQTMRTLWAHKLRSFLTMFGIAWGVGSLLLLIGFGEGFRSGQRKQLESIGQDIMFIFGGRVPVISGSFTSMRQYQLTWDDYEDIKSEARNLRAIAPVLQREDIRAQSEFNSTNGQVFGVVPDYAKIRTLNMGQGRWMNDSDYEEGRRVAVIGDEMRRNMFPGRPALGSTIVLNGARFEVIGVLEKIGREGNNGTNIRIFIPISTMRQMFPLKNAVPDAISFINYQPRVRGAHLEAKNEVRQVVARNHGFDWQTPDAYWEWDTIQNEKQVGKIFDAMNMFLGGVGVVTLALGAIGIINIMLVSVSERTREIGLRKALGATQRTILTQFFLEGAFLTLLSGGIGVAIAGGIMTALSGLPQPDGFDTPKIVPWSAALAVLSLATAGIIAGLYPARKAAMLEPVEALRQE